MDTQLLIERAPLLSGPVTVRRFDLRDAPQWDGFIERCLGATFFHRAGWREIIEDVFGHRCHYLVAERDGHWCGVMPLAEIDSRLFGHSLVSLPFAVYGGPVADDAESARALIDSAAKLAQALDVEHLEVRNREPHCSDWPTQNLYVTFRKELLPDVEANMLAIPRKQRAMVRKGMKNGLVSEIDATTDRFYRLYADNMHRHGTPPFPRRYFARLKELFGDSCEVLTVIDPRTLSRRATSRRTTSSTGS
jgi:FemAB-related protein (PEP-CTERM system-associated)